MSREQILKERIKFCVSKRSKDMAKTELKGIQEGKLETIQKCQDEIKKEIKGWDMMKGNLSINKVKLMLEELSSKLEDLKK